MSHSKPTQISWSKGKQIISGPNSWIDMTSGMYVIEDPGIATKCPFRLYNRYNVFICSYSTLACAKRSAEWMVDLNAMSVDDKPATPRDPWQLSQSNREDTQ